jgi:dihydroorotate dehydrogenase (fumarate)
MEKEETQMADISTSYMDISLASPVIVGASAFSKKTDNIKKAEEAGAGALVIHSLFQEQIELEALELDEALMVSSEHFAESLTYFPQLEHAGPREHVMWVEKARQAVKMPLLASLNASSMGVWVDYARQLESAGVDGLELNMYAVETDPNTAAADIEKRSLDVIAAVKSAVRKPVAVKLSPWYTSVANFAAKAVEAGASGLVLFNRFYQPTIDTDHEKLKISLDLSSPSEARLPLRWTAILSGEVTADIASSTGVHSGEDVIRMILAGAKAVQTVSTLYLHGLNHIEALNRQVSEWMDSKGYGSVADFRGKVSKEKTADPWAFERAQYVKLLLSRT